MLDAEHIIITDKAQIAHKILPEKLIVSVADAAENPRTVNLIRI